MNCHGCKWLDETRPQGAGYCSTVQRSKDYHTMPCIIDCGHRAPEVREIGNTLRDFQTCVGGYIETITLATDAVIICNEEGRLMGLPHNCIFCGVEFCGPIIVAGIDGDEFASLGPEEISAIISWFGYDPDGREAGENAKNEN